MAADKPSLSLVARVCLVAVGLAGSSFFSLWVAGAPVPLPAASKCSDGALGFAVDVLLVGLFGAGHSFLASTVVKKSLGHTPESHRALFTALSGVHLAAVPFAWQPLCGSVWSAQLSEVLPAPAWLVEGGLTGALALVVLGFRIGELAQFLGASGVEASTGETELSTTGAYGWVRHPQYAVLLAVLVCTTEMAWNRAAVLCGIAAYLYGLGLPLEEAKLIEELGPRYRDYRATTPAMIPGPLEFWLTGRRRQAPGRLD